MREAMLELLSYEPFEEIKGVEKEYISVVFNIKEFIANNEENYKVFETKYKLLNNDVSFDDIAGGFLSTFTEYKELNTLFIGWLNNKQCQDLDWLKIWLSGFNKRKYPVLFKKICYYLLLHTKVTEYGDVTTGKYSLVDSKGLGYSLDITATGRAIYDRELGIIIGLSSGKATNKVKIFTKWNLYSDYRLKSEKHTYSETTLNRNGAKAEYLTSLIQKLYYESARQTKNNDYKQQVDPTGWYAGVKQRQAISTTSDALPIFVDVFAGTGTVSASVNSKYKVVNDFDKNWISLIVMATRYRKILLDNFKKMLIDVLKGNYESSIQGYFNHQTYDYSNSSTGLLQYIDDTNFDKVFIESYRSTTKIDGGYGVARGLFDESYLKDLLIGDDMTTEWNIGKLKSIELVPYNRTFYQRVCNMFQYVKSILDNSEGYFVKIDDKYGVRDAINIDFNNDNDIQNNIDMLCKRACYLIYQFSFGTLGGSGESNVKKMDIEFFINIIKIFFNIKGFDNIEFTSKDVLNLEVSDLGNKRIFWDDWIKGLSGKNIICGSYSFENLFIADRAFYYLDSPYWLTKGYAAFFPDEYHVEMLDKFRNSEFNWLFSMQYFKGSKWTESGKTRKPTKGKHIIKNYSNYYRGFLEKFSIDGDFYVSKLRDDVLYPSLYVILFDKNKFKKNTSNKKNEGIEIMISNFNADGVLPYGEGIVQMPFMDFLKEADKDSKYEDIYNKAVEMYASRIKANHNLI